MLPTPPFQPLRIRPLRAALLGLSHPHSIPHLATLENLPEVGEIVAWDDQLDGKRHGELLRGGKKVVARTDDLNALLRRGDIDFAILCVPTDAAAAIARRVLAAGIHLMAEKPVGLTPAEIRSVAAAAKRAGATTGVLYGNRYSPGIVEARELVHSGAIGEVLTLDARLITTQVRFRDPKGWLFQRKRAGGGVLTWLGCHMIDLLSYVSGDPIVAVSALEVTRSGEKIDVEDAAALVLRFRSGAIGTFHAAYALAFSGGGYLNSGGTETYFACHGRKGRVVWPTRQSLHIEAPVKRGNPIREHTYSPKPSASYGGLAGEAFVRQFILASLGKGKSPATVEDALRVAEVLEAAKRSSKTGREVRVKQV